jgi:hypothetical protein
MMHGGIARGNFGWSWKIIKTKVLNEKMGHIEQNFFCQSFRKIRFFMFHSANFLKFLPIFRYSHPWNVFFLAGNSNFYRNYFCHHEYQKSKDDYNGKLAEILERVQSGFSDFDETLPTICPHFSFQYFN